MTKTGKIIIWSLVAILVAVVSYLVIQLMKISKAPLTYAGIKINSVSLAQIDLTVYFKLLNTGTASVTISKQEYDVFINGKLVSHMKYSEPFTISPGENIVPMEVTIKLADALRAGISNLSDIINDKSKININLKGRRGMRIGFLSFNNVVTDETFNLGDIKTT